MNPKFLLITIISVIASFAGGFLLANSLNRNEMSRLQTENATLQKNQIPNSQKAAKQELTNDQIESRLKESEENPEDFSLQKGLGLALYRYAGAEKDKVLLEKVVDVLERAYKINPDDYQVVVSLGNLYYDLGQLNDDEKSNLRAREFYSKALKKNEKDSFVRTDYALTFLLTDSPDRTIAIAEFEKALEFNKRNEKALVFITQAFIEEGNMESAENYLNKLKEINPKNEKISELEAEIAKK